MPPPGFIIGMILAAVAVVLIILRTRSHRELNQSALRLRRSQERLGNSLDELDEVIKMAQAKLAEKDAASASEPAPPGDNSNSGRQHAARCSRCGNPTPALPFARIPTRGRLGPAGYGYARRRRKTAARRP